eukprot:COSAG06_NODE_2194_length_7378_cov_25.108119_1_plen_47_part_00
MAPISTRGTYGIVVPEHAMTVCAMSAGGCVQQANGAFPGRCQYIAK